MASNLVCRVKAYKVAASLYSTNCWPYFDYNKTLQVSAKDVFDYLNESGFSFLVFGKIQRKCCCCKMWESRVIFEIVDNSLFVLPPGTRNKIKRYTFRFIECNISDENENIFSLCNDLNFLYQPYDRIITFKQENVSLLTNLFWSGVQIKTTAVCESLFNVQS